MTGEELLRDHGEKPSQGDLEGAISMYKEDAVLHYPGQGPLAGDYRGRDEIKRFFINVGERTGAPSRPAMRHSSPIRITQRHWPR